MVIINKSVVQVSIPSSQVDDFKKDIREIKRFIKSTDGFIKSTDGFIKSTEGKVNGADGREAKWRFKEKWCGGVSGKCSICGFVSHSSDCNPFPNYCGGCGAKIWISDKLETILNEGYGE